MVTEDYVSFETAKPLKDKGFDENCAALYDSRTSELSRRGDYWRCPAHPGIEDRVKRNNQ